MSGPDWTRIERGAGGGGLVDPLDVWNVMSTGSTGSTPAPPRYVPKIFKMDPVPNTTGHHEFHPVEHPVATGVYERVVGTIGGGPIVIKPVHIIDPKPSVPPPPPKPIYHDPHPRTTPPAGGHQYGDQDESHFRSYHDRESYSSRPISGYSHLPDKVSSTRSGGSSGGYFSSYAPAYGVVRFGRKRRNRRKRIKFYF